jgi:hypothetical protein
VPTTKQRPKVPLTKDVSNPKLVKRRNTAVVPTDCHRRREPITKVVRNHFAPAVCSVVVRTVKLRPKATTLKTARSRLPQLVVVQAANTAVVRMESPRPRVKTTRDAPWRRQRKCRRPTQRKNPSPKQRTVQNQSMVAVRMERRPQLVQTSKVVPAVPSRMDVATTDGHRPRVPTRKDALHAPHLSLDAAATERRRLMDPERLAVVCPRHMAAVRTTSTRPEDQTVKAATANTHRMAAVPTTTLRPLVTTTLAVAVNMLNMAVVLTVQLRLRVRSTKVACVTPSNLVAVPMA